MCVDQPDPRRPPQKRASHWRGDLIADCARLRTRDRYDLTWGALAERRALELADCLTRLGWIRRVIEGVFVAWGGHGNSL